MIVSPCPFCEYPNSTVAKFCNDCGSPLHLKPCRACDAINDGSVKFCYLCGAAFEAHTIAPDSAAAVLRAHRMAGSNGGTVSSDNGNNTSNGRPIEEPAPVVRRGATASLLPVVVFGVIGVGIYYFGYLNPLPLKDWANAAMAAVGINRETTAAPANSESTSASIAPAPPAESTTAPAKDAVSSTPPTLQAMAPVVSPPQAAPPESVPPAPTGVPAAPGAKKTSTSHKAAAKKTKNAAAKKATPTLSKSAPTPVSGQN